MVRRPPIGPQMPGDLTRWMGLPWQCDAFSCQQVLMQEDFPTAVWWPALLPVDVLPEVYYLQLLREDLPASERQRFYKQPRGLWSRGGGGDRVIMPMRATGDGITNMIRLWERMGFLEEASRPDGSSAARGHPGGALRRGRAWQYGAAFRLEARGRASCRNESIGGLR